jgi:hypothetical protein
VALGGERVNAESRAPACPRLEVAAVGRRRLVGATHQPGSGEAEERVVSRARKVIERSGANRRHWTAIAAVTGTRVTIPKRAARCDTAGRKTPWFLHSGHVIGADPGGVAALSFLTVLSVGSAMRSR